MIGKIDLDDVLFAVSLDSLGKQIVKDESAHDGLFMHVSKPPKEGQPAYEFSKVVARFFFCFFLFLFSFRSKT